MEMGRRVLEETLLEILARLPLRSIARFKSVCKTWKSVLESAYFRRLFLSLHKNSTCSWSLMFRTGYSYLIAEAIGFHGCKTWDLPKSLRSYLMSFDQFPELQESLCCYVAYSNGLVWITKLTGIEDMLYGHKFFVGNPVLQEWVEIPRPPKPWAFSGLVTRVEEDGLVSSFKVIITETKEREMNEWKAYVYSSETGTWTFKRLLSSCPLYFTASNDSVNLNGMLYLWGKRLDPAEPDFLVAHDFYGPEADDKCRVIPLPLPYNKHVKRCLTTSRGDVIYIEILDRRLKVWRLNNNNNNSESSECWQLLRGEINMTSIRFDVDCIPLAMNPFDSDIVYLWNLQHGRLVSCNLQTQEFILHRGSENWGSSEGRFSSNAIKVSQFVLPQWLDSVPRPPS